MTQPKYPKVTLENQPDPVSASRGGYNLDPENYPDTGCSYSPSCLSCPLPQCRYDMAPGELQLMLRRWSDQTIARSVFGGLPVDEVATKHGVTVRTIHRVVKRVREEGNV